MEPPNHLPADRAAALLDHAIAAASGIGDARSRCRALWLIGRNQRRLGSTEQANSTQAKARAAAKKIEPIEDRNFWLAAVIDEESKLGTFDRFNYIAASTDRDIRAAIQVALARQCTMAGDLDTAREELASAWRYAYDDDAAYSPPQLYAICVRYELDELAAELLAKLGDDLDARVTAVVHASEVWSSTDLAAPVYGSIAKTALEERGFFQLGRLVVAMLQAELGGDVVDLIDRFIALLESEKRLREGAGDFARSVRFATMLAHEMGPSFNTDGLGEPLTRILKLAPRREKAEVLGLMAVVAARAGQFEDAFGFARRISPKMGRTEDLADVLSIAHGAGAVEWVAGALDEIVKAAKKVRGAEAKHAAADAIQQLVLCGEPEQAEALFLKHNKKDPHDGSIFCGEILVHAATLAGEWWLVDRHLDESLPDRTRASRLTAIKEVATHAAKRGEREVAIRYASQFEEERPESEWLRDCFAPGEVLADTTRWLYEAIGAEARPDELAALLAAAQDPAERCHLIIGHVAGRERLNDEPWFAGDDD